jgi:hypothetical protein
MLIYAITLLVFGRNLRPSHPYLSKHEESTYEIDSTDCINVYLLPYGAEPFLIICQLCRHSGTSQHFKEPEDTSLCSQEPSTGSYPEPDRFSPYHPILSL